MSNFDIGLSGLHVAQRSLELISTNIANATTPGYHRQDAVIQTMDISTFDGVSIGGARIAYVRRNADRMLELEILRQRSALGSTEQELNILETVENTFGQLNAQDLGAAMNEFFDSLTELGAQPDSQALQDQAVWLADSVAGKFRDLGTLLSDLQEQVRVQIQQSVEQLNRLASEVATLNSDVANAVAHGGTGNLACDRRDQAVSEMADLVGLQAFDSTSMTAGVNVSIWGRNVVDQQRTTELSFAQDSYGKLNLKAGDQFCSGDTVGGKLGALFTFMNTTLVDLRGGLDDLASEVIQGINALHVQGVGSAGSFSELTGSHMLRGTLASWDAGVTAGELSVRVVDAATGQAVRHTLTVNPATQTLDDVTDWLDSLGHLSASIVDGALNIRADAGYKFDFLPTLATEPASSDVTGTAGIAVGGYYTGSANRVFTVTASGTGDVGVTDGLRLGVYSGSGELVRTVNVGAGYAAGEAIDLGNGIHVTLGAGSLNDGDEFTIQALARSDTSGFLAAAGMNTLFTGNSAGTIGVRAAVLNDSRLLAVSSSESGLDSLNALAMAGVGDKALGGLGGLSPQDHFDGIRTGVAQSIVVARARQASQEGLLRQLGAQRDEISGVDINEEAAKLIVFERMYQAMSRAIAAQDTAMKHLFDIL